DRRRAESGAHPADHRRRDRARARAHRAPRSQRRAPERFRGARSPARRRRACDPLAKDTIMARILGAIASSHTPTIGFAYDRNKRDDPAWAPIFENFAPLSAWIADNKPDVLLMIYNDHVS